MRKSKLFFFFLMITVLLSGCISIPLSDGGTLELSTDGVNVIQGEGNEEETDEGEITDVDSDEVDDEKIIEDQAIGDEEDSDEMLIDEGFGGCVDEFYLLSNRIVDGFPISHCPEFNYIEIVMGDDERDVYASYQAYYEIFDEYAMFSDFFENTGYTIDFEQARGQSALIEAHDDTMKIKVEAETYSAEEPDMTTVQITYSETPAREHKVQNSMLNWDEQTKQYGTCSDEYYVLTKNIIEGFPLGDCFDVTYLRVDFDEQGHSVGAVYNTTGDMDELMDLYGDFMRDQGYPSETEWNLADDADAVFLVNYKGLEVIMKFVQKGEVLGIQLNYTEMK